MLKVPVIRFGTYLLHGFQIERKLQPDKINCWVPWTTRSIINEMRISQFRHKDVTQIYVAMDDDTAIQSCEPLLSEIPGTMRLI